MQILEDKNKGMVIIGKINISNDNLKETFKIFEENVRDMEAVGKEWITFKDNRISWTGEEPIAWSERGRAV